LKRHWPTALVLASGRGERFLASGGTTHKLRAPLAGKPVLEHVLDAVRASGLPWHLEDAGHPGMGDSIAAAVRATPDAHGWLILPGDLPLIQSATLCLLADALADNQTSQQPARARHFQVVIPVVNGQRGHPVGFSAACRDSLLNLKGNKGAASVLASYVAIEIVVNDVGCVTDIDTVQDLQRAQALIGAGQPSV
jgi:molybdenum cofactor cytidylyltransferase